jgi:hypothetical protein
MKQILKHFLKQNQLLKIGILVLMFNQELQILSIFQQKERSKREFGVFQFLYGLQNINLIQKSYLENALKEIGHVVKLQNL